MDSDNIAFEPLIAHHRPPRNRRFFFYGSVEISAFESTMRLIRSIDRVSLDWLHFGKFGYTPGGTFAAGILLLCQRSFEKLFLLFVRCPVITIVEIGSPFICMACI